MLPSSCPSSSWGVNVISCMNEDKTRGMPRCVALLRLREIQQCIKGHYQNKKARSTFVWTGSICPPNRVNLAGRKGNGDDEIVGWNGPVFSLVWLSVRPEGQRIRCRVISSPRLQRGHSSSLLGERTNAVNTPHQRPSEASDNNSTSSSSISVELQSKQKERRWWDTVSRIELCTKPPSGFFWHHLLIYRHTVPSSNAGIIQQSVFEQDRFHSWSR